MTDFTAFLVSTIWLFALGHWTAGIVSIAIFVVFVMMGVLK